MTRSSKGLLITVVAIAVVAIAVVAIATSTTGINNTEDPKPSSGKEELARRIQISVDVAGSKNKQAVLFCDTEINTILALQFPEVERQGQKAAEDIAAYGSCCKIIYSLVRDKIDKKNTTDLYVDEQMQANLSPPLRQLSGDLETTIGRFDLLLRESTVGLAYDLAAMNPRNSAGNISLPVDLKSNNYIREALKNLGFGVVTVGIFIP